MTPKAAFIQQLLQTFPGLASRPLEDLISDNLISHFSVEIPEKVVQQAQRSIELFYSLREKPSYIAHYEDQLKAKGIQDPGNKSIMMSYDFHVDENQNLKLIEVNTNAAFLVLGHQMYASKNHALPVHDFNLNEIGANIRTEMKLQGKTVADALKIAIIDENPSEQRLYVEFLVYQELFKSFGWNCHIEDFREVFENFDPEFIYNRYTDFFLSDDRSKLLREKFLNRDVCLSPNPFEYFLLADKQRMIDWGVPGFLEAHGFSGADLELLRQTVPKAYDVCQDKGPEIWAERKKLFFKPKNAFGSKQSYRGATISKRTFEEMMTQDMIAQEYIPAPEVTYATPEGPQAFKYDLRCYAYQGRLQLIIARLYQGQVTNLRTPYGGFTSIIVK
jgi:hypothetical protein